MLCLSIGLGATEKPKIGPLFKPDVERSCWCIYCRPRSFYKGHDLWELDKDEQQINIYIFFDHTISLEVSMVFYFILCQIPKICHNMEKSICSLLLQCFPVFWQPGVISKNWTEEDIKQAWRMNLGRLPHIFCIVWWLATIFIVAAEGLLMSPSFSKTKALKEYKFLRC